jgi:predicted nuclease with RNAse H fold
LLNRTVGIDLASQAGKTACSAIEWGDSLAVVSFGSDTSDSGLLAFMSSATKVGIDCPFGWPVDFVAAVSAHSRHEPWPPQDHTHSEELRNLRFRETDRRIAAQVNGRWPLSVSTDLIGVVAIRYARLASRLAAAGHDVNRDGSGLVAETYPAAALRHWGVKSRGYKGAHSAQHLPTMVDEVLTLMPWLRFSSDEAERQCRTSHDAFDALVCALIARAVDRGESTAPTTAEDGHLALIEGWIHVPTEGACGLLAGRSPEEEIHTLS